MLDSIHPWGRPIRPFLPKGVTASVAGEAWQIREYFRLRREIFGIEQGLFAGSDRDEFDDDAVPIVASSGVAGVVDEIVGVVRIYRTDDDTYFGGRLGVAQSHRRVGAIGTALITCAVSTAHRLGCQRFFATVQEKNVKYFERHRFSVRESLMVCGRPHQLMEADLHAYPPELSVGPVPAIYMGRTVAA